MKRLTTLAIIAALLVALSLPNGSLVPLAMSYPHASYLLYVDGSPDPIECRAADARKTAQRAGSVYAETLRIPGHDLTQELLTRLNVEVFDTYTIGDVTIAEGYYRHGKPTVSLPTGRVNVQIAYRDGMTVIGTPLIAGTY